MNKPVACLYIGEMESGGDATSGLRSVFGDGIRKCLLEDGEMWTTGKNETEVCIERFDWRRDRRLYGQLLGDYQRLRRRFGEATIVALGRGCAAALALAEQVTVERLALIRPELRVKRGSSSRERQLSRVAAFARRNLACCASDILCCQSACSPMPARLQRETRGRFFPFFQGEGDRESINNAILLFLTAGECPKSLAD